MCLGSVHEGVVLLEFTGLLCSQLSGDFCVNKFVTQFFSFLVVVFERWLYVHFAGHDSSDASSQVFYLQILSCPVQTVDFVRGFLLQSVGQFVGVDDDLFEVVSFDFGNFGEVVVDDFTQIEDLVPSVLINGGDKELSKNKITG